MANTSLTLSPDQEQANTKIKDFIKDKKDLAGNIVETRDKTITVGGYAGTGKTTLIAHTAHQLRKELDNPSFAFITFTNKAWKVLENKLDNSIFEFTDHDFIGTIHKFLHDIKTVSKDKPVPHATHRIKGEDEDTVFIPKREVDQDIIFTDEASMLPFDMYKQMSRYDFPIVAVGDHGQLPPVNDDFNLMEEPDVTLENIHRQAEENNIIKFCEEIRKQGMIPKDLIDGDDIRNVTYNPMEFFNNQDLTKWQFLSWKNESRVKINKKIRNLLGFETELRPEPGDKVICLRNNHEHFVYNGMIGKVKDIDSYNQYLYEGTIQFDDFEYTGKFIKDQFHEENYSPPAKKISRSVKDFVNVFDYGYCTTVHKFQGSQAKNICLYHDANKSFMNRVSNIEDEYKRWLYTACSRAEEQLALMGEQN